MNCQKTRPEDSIGSDEDWEDSIRRTWQCGTIQLDFQLPLNFQAEYIDEDNVPRRPVMIHRVVFGSIERFLGILIEHYAGKFPVWLAPVQVKILPVSEKTLEYSRTVCQTLLSNGIRCEVDMRDERIGYKIREAQQVARVPYMLVLGAKEVESNTVTVRKRDSAESTAMSLANISRWKRRTRRKIVFWRDGGDGMQIQYRKLTKKDLDTFIQMRICQLREEGAAEETDLVPALRDYYTRHMADGTFVSWLALDGDEIIGTSGMSFVEKPPWFGCPSGRIGLLSGMFTDPAYRRQGIAKELLSRVIDEARAYGCGTIQITASDMGVLLYTDFGFVKNGNFMQYKL